jgi:hypothetical protein
MRIGIIAIAGGVECVVRGEKVSELIDYFGLKERLSF